MPYRSHWGGIAYRAQLAGEEHEVVELLAVVAARLAVRSFGRSYILRGSSLGPRAMDYTLWTIIPTRCKLQADSPHTAGRNWEVQVLQGSWRRCGEVRARFAYLLESCLDVLCSAFGIEFHGFWPAANVEVTLFVFFHTPPLEIHGL